MSFSLIKSLLPSTNPITIELKKFSTTTISSSDLELNKEVDFYIDAVSALHVEKDRSQYLEKAAALIPLDRLQNLTHENALEKAQDMVKVAKYYLKTTERPSSLTLKGAMHSFLDALSTALDSVVNSFGLHRFFKPSRGEGDNSRSHIITGLVSMVTLFTTLILPLVGAALAAPIIGGLFILISVIGFVFPYIKPMPHFIPDADNWTRKAQNQTLQRGLTNKVVLEHLATVLATNKKVIITGLSRVGKTQTAKDLTYALTEGSKEVTKSLPVISQVFSWNSASLIPSKLDGSGVQKIRDAIGRHIHKTLTVFDEFGKTCTDRKNNTMVAQLLTELDDKFDKVIALATQEEYELLCEMHPSLRNRFVQFKIESLASSDTENILHHTLLQEAPKVLVEGEALEYLVHESKRRFKNKYPEKALPPQPHTSKELLRKCMQKVSETQKLPESKSLEKIRGQLDSVYPKAAVTNSIASGEIRKHYAQLRESKKEHALAKERFANLGKMQNTLLSTKKEMNRTVLKIAKLNQKSLASASGKKMLGSLLLQERMITRLQDSIKKEAALLNVRVVIDKSLVDEVLQEEL